MCVNKYNIFFFLLAALHFGTFSFKPVDIEVHTFFGRVNENGTLINRASPQYNFEIENKPRIDRISKKDAKSIKLEVWPNVVKNGGRVTVLWQGVEQPHEKDYVAYYCPYFDDSSHYLDYFYLKEATDWKQGYGHYEVVLFNFRHSCNFRYYRRTGKTYTLAATSNLVHFDDGGPYAPLQGHLALTNNPAEMRVMWVSGEVPEPPLVRYGKTKQLDMKEVAHTTRTYTREDMCDFHAVQQRHFWHPGITYDFLLKDLEPNTLYHYSYGTESFMSPIANFTTAIPKGENIPFNFVIYGDMSVLPYPQAYTTAHNVRNDLDLKKHRFIQHIGDISYAQGYAYVWEKWGWLIEPYASLVPYMLGIGNHEYDHLSGGIGKDPSGIKTAGGWKPKWFPGTYDSGGECAVPVYKRYHMPDTGNSIFWYSFDFGLVHMIMFSTEHDYTPGSVQYKWLEKDLKSVDRKVTPWLLVGGHRPMYSSEYYESDHTNGIYMQKYLEDLFYKYKVDITFWAHQHTYERTCKMYKNKCVDDGIMHLIVGMAGRRLDTHVYKKKEWSIKHVKEFGFGRMYIVNATAMRFEMVNNKHYMVRDHVWLFK